MTCRPSPLASTLPQENVLDLKPHTNYGHNNNRCTSNVNLPPSLRWDDKEREAAMTVSVFPSLRAKRSNPADNNGLPRRCHPTPLTHRLVVLFRRLLSLVVDLSLIAIFSFSIWVKAPWLILPCGWAYYALCSAWLNQRSIGMRLTGLTLIQHAPSSRVYVPCWRSALCQHVALGFIMTLGTAGVGYIACILMRRDGRTLHELMRGTHMSIA